MSIEENVQIVKDFFAAIGGNRQNLLALASVGRKSEPPSAIFTRIGATGKNTGVKGEAALSPSTPHWKQNMAEGAALFHPTTDTYIILHAQCRLSGKHKNHVNGVNEAHCCRSVDDRSWPEGNRRVSTNTPKSGRRYLNRNVMRAS